MFLILIDRHDTCRQVCAWRHKNWKLCSVLPLAIKVIRTLRHKGNEIVFRQPDKSVPAEWWDIPLIDWEDYSCKLKCIFFLDVYVR